MKNRLGRAPAYVVAIALTVGIASVGVPAWADDGADASLDTAVAASLREQLVQRAAEEGVAVTFGRISVDVSDGLADEYSDDPDDIATAILDADENSAGASTAAKKPRSSRLRVVAAATTTRTYTASVFSGVPAIGVSWVKQDFSASVSNGSVGTVKFLGSSTQTGAALCAWSGNYSSYKKPSASDLNIYMKGNFSGLVKGSFVSFDATFVAFFHVKSGALVQDAQ